MDGRCFDMLTRAMTASPSRRTVLSVLGGGTLITLLGLAEAEARKRKKKKRKKKRCKKQECCRDADCGPLFLCAQGACVMGQGTCPSDTPGCQAVSFGCGLGPESECACYQSTVGNARCGANTILPDSECSECVNDDDCAELYPDIPGIFCARGGPECSCASPNSGFCQAPCDD
jgi:hypothetical protein